MAIIAMIVAAENRFIFRGSTSFVFQIVPRVIALIVPSRAGISHLQRLPASITRATIVEAEKSRPLFSDLCRN